jgi:hypothetical protein
MRVVAVALRMVALALAQRLVLVATGVVVLVQPTTGRLVGH